MVLLENGARRLDRSSGEHTCLEVVSERCGFAILTPRITVEFEDQRNEKSEDEDREKKGNSLLIMPTRMLQRIDSYPPALPRRDASCTSSVVLASLRASTI
jgi:hypothetical protein